MNNDGKDHSCFSCVILAAGLSTRMGQSKIILPWGSKSVVGTIIDSFKKTRIRQIIVVTGGYRDEVEAEVAKFNAEIVFNPDFKNGEMIRSFQVGMSILNPECSGVFVALGDQPEIDVIDILGIMDKSDVFPDKLIIPSYSMRRGHPWLVPKVFFNEIRIIRTPDTMKTFIQKHEREIEYYLVQKSNILADLDTPEDYQRLKPKKEN